MNRRSPGSDAQLADPVLIRRWQLYAVGAEIDAVRRELAFAEGFAKGRKRLPKWLLKALDDASRHAEIARAEYLVASQLANDDVERTRGKL